MAKPENPLTGVALIKEVCRRIRVALSYWEKALREAIPEEIAH
jgi:hypothetical protein